MSAPAAGTAAAAAPLADGPAAPTAPAGASEGASEAEASTAVAEAAATSAAQRTFFISIADSLAWSPPCLGARGGVISLFYWRELGDCSLDDRRERSLNCFCRPGAGHRFIRPPRRGRERPRAKPGRWLAGGRALWIAGNRVPRVVTGGGSGG